MREIFDLLKQKEAQLELLQKQVEALKVTASLMIEEQALFGKSEPADSKSLSQAEMIREVLRDKGQPMHVKDISEAIRKRFQTRIKPSYLAPVFYRYIKAGKLFYKVENRPNTFGLVEWRVRQMPLDSRISGNVDGK